MTMTNKLVCMMIAGSPVPEASLHAVAIGGTS